MHQEGKENEAKTGEEEAFRNSEELIRILNPVGRESDNESRGISNHEKKLLGSTILWEMYDNFRG
jgi:hypothetical protein